MLLCSNVAFNNLFSHITNLLQPWRSAHYAGYAQETQGRSPNVVKVIYLTLRNSESKFFPFREVPILKRDAIEENHCLIQ